MAMQTIKAFLATPLFGFLLKVSTSIAAVVFGILGVGLQTRKPDGHLNRNGWIALSGIVVAGLLALGTSAYEFIVGEKKDQAEHEKSQKLLLTVQSGLYPFREVSGSFTVRFTGKFADLTEYRNILAGVMPKDKFSHTSTKDFFYSDQDDDGSFYAIPATSRLFPNPNSRVVRFLNRLAVSISFVRFASGDKKQPYQVIGGTSFTVGEIHFQKHVLRFQPTTQTMWYDVSGFTLPDALSLRSGIYSIAEIFPGFLAASPTIVGPCDKLLNLTCSPFGRADTQEGVSLDELRLTFQYPKALRIDSDSIHCHSKERGNLIIEMFPEDIGVIDERGNIAVIVPSSAHEKSICNAFNDPGF
jgi:hypothetical protein